MPAVQPKIVGYFVVIVGYCCISVPSPPCCISFPVVELIFCQTYNFLPAVVNAWRWTSLWERQKYILAVGGGISSSSLKCTHQVKMEVCTYTFNEQSFGNSCCCVHNALHHSNYWKNSSAIVICRFESKYPHFLAFIDIHSLAINKYLQPWQSTSMIFKIFVIHTAFFTVF